MNKRCKAGSSLHPTASGRKNSTSEKCLSQDELHLPYMECGVKDNVKHITLYPRTRKAFLMFVLASIIVAVTYCNIDHLYAQPQEEGKEESSNNTVLESQYTTIAVPAAVATSSDSDHMSRVSSRMDKLEAMLENFKSEMATPKLPASDADVVKFEDSPALGTVSDLEISALSSSIEELSLCSRRNIVCERHEPERTTAKSANAAPPLDVCKTLWFSGFHEGRNSACKKDGHGYADYYSAAFLSVMANAGDSIQPVLMLGRYGMENENSTELTKVG